MNCSMGRRRKSNLDLPPRMHKKGGAYYHVSSTLPRVWTKLGKDLNRARTMWAHLESAGCTDKFSGVLDAWMLSPQYTEELSDGTKTTYGSVIKQLKDYFDGASVRDIEAFHIAQWLDNHRSKIQANTGKAIASKVFEYAIRNGLAKFNPCREIGRNKIKGRDRYLTHDEFRAIRAAGNRVIQISMDIGYLTGARPSDILKATLADCREEGFYIRQKKTDAKQLFVWTPELRAVIEEAKALHQGVTCLRLLCNSEGKPYTYTTFNEYWLSARKKAGIENAQFRDIRAKSATDAEEAGIDHQALLGHTSKRMSDRYVKIRRPNKVQPMKRVL